MKSEKMCMISFCVPAGGARFLAARRGLHGADRAARELITREGYGNDYRHGTGHGVGIEIHEQPVLSPASKQVLAPGHVVTVEPGIYLPGRFGVRIEDMAFLTQDGCENLTNAPKDLIVLPV